MRSQLTSRLRSSSLTAVPPPQSSSDYSTDLARTAASILYRSPLPSRSGLSIYVLNAAAFPDTHEIDYDALLPYVLARLPGEDELLSGTEYEVIFFAGGGPDGATASRKGRPGWGWFVQAYHVLSRAMRKRLQRLYIVHERAWVRILVEMFSTIVSPKFRRKIVHVSTLSALALHLPIEDLLIPPSVYLHDRRLSPDIHAPYASGRRAFSVRQPLPKDYNGNSRLPRVLRETTSFLLIEQNIRVEGLFRIPPNSRLKGIVREAYDRGQKFIVWKEQQVMLPVPNLDGVQGLPQILSEVDQRDAYGVHLAAGLIKTWYAELRQPLFPQSCYRDLRKCFGNSDDIPTLAQLTEMISPQSEWSILPLSSREILTRHLLPLLATIASYQEYNRMTSENLAVCFAPALVCGPDQLEDAKMSSIIRRILTVAVDYWPNGLRQSCGINANAFQFDLLPPRSPQDFEDPLEGSLSGDDVQVDDLGDTQSHFTGVVMKDNDQQPPPLPPRPSESGRTDSNTSPDDVLPKRKPAPPILVPPRYSTIMTDEAGGMAESPTSYAAVVDGFGPPRHSSWSFDDKEKPPQSSTQGAATSISTSSALPPYPPQITLPKRKALTAEQVDNADSSNVLQPQTRSRSASNAPTAGVVAVQTADVVRRKPVQPPDVPGNAGAVRRNDSDGHSTTTQADVQPREGSDSRAGEIDAEFANPEWPASAGRPGSRTSLPVQTHPVSQTNGDGPSTSQTGSHAPIITSLARPLYPSPTSTTPQSRHLSTSQAANGVRTRAPSPGILQRMPSFEQRDNAHATSVDGTTPQESPHRLNIRKAAVDDLRRLYEERAGTARTLVEAGVKRKEVPLRKGGDG